MCRVEKVLRDCGAALVWITHDAEQPARVGSGRVLELPMGTLSEPLPPSAPLDEPQQEPLEINFEQVPAAAVLV
jgi:hypothetical protein